MKKGISHGKGVKKRGEESSLPQKLSKLGEWMKAHPTPKRKSCLSEMLDKITDQNMHKEVETGGPVGKEIW